MINGIACTFAVTVDQPRGPNPTVRLVSGSQGSVSITSYKHGATTELRLSCGRIWSFMSHMCSIPYLIDSLTTNSLTLLLSTHVLHYTPHAMWVPLPHLSKPQTTPLKLVTCTPRHPMVLSYQARPSSGSSCLSSLARNEPKTRVRWLRGAHATKRLCG